MGLPNSDEPKPTSDGFLACSFTYTSRLLMRCNRPLERKSLRHITQMLLMHKQAKETLGVKPLCIAQIDVAKKIKKAKETFGDKFHRVSGLVAVAIKKGTNN